MRRAALPPVIALAALLLPANPPLAQVERVPDVIDGTGMVDFTQRPRFEVGTWLKYRTVGSSFRGHKSDYTVTILVAGEEVFWGEPCVWIESWTEKPGGRRLATASLLSYTAFGDTLAPKHVVWFLRKTINGYTPQGQPDITLYTRNINELKLRRVNYEENEDKVEVDSLGRDTTTTPAGRLEVLKVLRKRAHAETVEKGDSTVYYERRINRTYHYSHEIPLTSLAKIEIHDVQQGKTWLAGRFDASPFNVLELVEGATELIEHGSGGLTPLLVPEPARRTIDRRLVEHALSMPQEPPVKVLKRPGS
jgi:hypothetical protein